MRKVTFGGANSLDNFIADDKGRLDWLMWGKEVAEINKDYWQSVDTILMGRKTLEAALKMNAGSMAFGDGNIKCYVFSRNPKTPVPDGVELISDDACQFLASLKRRKGKDICVMGGGDLARSFFEAGLIDEIGFNIHPVLLGAGARLFYEMDHRINLRLIECRTFENGCVFVKYQVEKPRRQKKTKK